eukprot:TRINITY_DN38328_c0_g1_i1.p1 TRINITY_DN38328_c0_g1~~TRINITY_DN38328_c0_g1_i1.p1  ORF type:complete len:209 (+),score=36.64 TRINITY_DN38328_c0_g1_i1:436-1062(+)
MTEDVSSQSSASTIFPAVLAVILAVKPFLLALQFFLALGGILYLKESSPYFSRLVTVWWSTSCGIAILTIYAAISQAMLYGTTIAFVDIIVGVAMFFASMGHFSGYYASLSPPTSGQVSGEREVRARRRASDVRKETEVTGTSSEREKILAQLRKDIESDGSPKWGSALVGGGTLEGSPAWETRPRRLMFDSVRKDDEGLNGKENCGA